MAHYLSTHTGQEIDEAVSKVLDGLTTVTVVLASNAWIDNSQTVIVTAVTDTNNVIFAPYGSKENADNYAAAGIICIEPQTSGSLTFVCNTVPTADITINIIIAD